MYVVAAEIERFVATLRLDQPQGVSVEIDHFIPEGWTWSVDAEGFHIQGPASKLWLSAVRRMVVVLAYGEGSLLRRISPWCHELYTWRNMDGDGFKVVFTGLDETES